MASTGVLSAFAALASASSMAYQFASLMIYKAAEVGANTAIAIIQKRSGTVAETIGEVQFILTELDIEAKFKTVRSLLTSIQDSCTPASETEKDFVKVCVTNVEDAIDLVSATLLRIQNAMDEHARLWFNTYRTLNVVDDLNLLKAQCRMFDKRLEVLMQCLTVPAKTEASTPLYKELDMVDQKIFNSAFDEMDEFDGLNRMKSIMMAERALKDAKFDEDHYVDQKTSITEPYSSLLFEDPIFL